MALITLPAATLLLSHDGDSLVVGELGTLLSKIHSNRLDLQALVPLLTKVIENAPDEEIWDVVYELVPKPTSMRLLTPPEDSTPSTPKRKLLQPLSNRLRPFTRHPE